MSILKFLVTIFTLAAGICCKAQSMESPVICHDEQGYLKLYNDGVFPLYFANSHFKYYISADSSAKFDNDTKEFVFKPSRAAYLHLRDTLFIKLYKHFLLIRTGKQVIKTDTAFHDMQALSKIGMGVKYKQ